MAEIEHGGNLTKAIEIYGGKASDWLDLSTGISPFSPPIPELSIDLWRRLPEQSSLRKLEQDAKEFYASNLSCLATAGSQFMINLLPRLLPSDVGIIRPGYGEYANAFNREGVKFKFLDDLDDIKNTRSIILAHPNNPDGRFFSINRLIKLAEQLKREGGQLVIDEAFCAPLERQSLLPLLREGTNIIILKSFGKFFGLAGIRLGFVFCAQEMREKINHHIGPWSLTSPTISVALHVLSLPDISQKLAAKIHNRHDEMKTALAATGLKLIGDNPLFFLIHHVSALKLYEYLMSNHILVRKFDYNKFWLRIGLSNNRHEDQRLCQVIMKFRS